MKSWLKKNYPLLLAGILAAAPASAQQVQVAGPLPITGTWTPTLVGDGTPGTPTYIAQVGNYIYIDHHVTAQFTIAITSTTGMVGNVLLGGLPFANTSTLLDLGECVFATYNGIDLTATYTSIGAYMNISSSQAIIVQAGSGNTLLQLPVSGLNVTPNSQLRGFCIYRTDS